jgi:hypothetical protein
MILFLSSSFTQLSALGTQISPVSSNPNDYQVPSNNAQGLQISQVSGLGLVANPEPASSGNLYVDYSQNIANLEHKYMLGTNGGYRSGANRTWLQILDSSRSFLGNTFIVRGTIELFARTGNAIYLSWAKDAANSLWAKAWDNAHNGFYTNYDDSWKNTTCSQPLQENAEFVHISLGLYDSTGNSTYYSWANQTMNYIMSRFHDATYGGIYNIWSPCSNAITDSTKHLENSLGAFVWAAMRWYHYAHNSTAQAMTASQDS